MDTWYRLMTEFGLGATLSVMIFIAFFFLLKWVLGVSGEQLKMMALERQSWVQIQHGFNEQLKGLQEQIRMNMATNRSFHESVIEAHKYQREEHKEMITCLGRINGYKHD